VTLGTPWNPIYGLGHAVMDEKYGVTHFRAEEALLGQYRLLELDRGYREFLQCHLARPGLP
jgi:hypothetical protein